MKLLVTLVQIILLFLVYEVGVLIQEYFGLFIPGSVIGLILMFLLLTTGLLKVNWVEEGAKSMNKHLVLFFIPATVGIMNHYELFAGKGIFLIVIVLFSTILVMATAGLVSQWLVRKGDGGNA